MRFLEMQQGTAEWLQARATRITASRFAEAVSRIGELDERQAKYVALVLDGMEKSAAVAAAGYKAAPSSDTVRRALLGEDTTSPSDTARRYAADLAIERISGQPHGEPPKAWVLDRGHEMEARARMIYEARTGAFITESGICISDDGIFSYSSDGLCDDDGLIEIKAPIDSIKIMEMWRAGDTGEYDHQIQGGLWLTGRKWCDFIMYVPDLAPAGKDLYVKRIYRDEQFIDKMVSQLVEFDKLVNEYVAVLRGPDYTPPEEEVMPELIPQEATLQEIQPSHEETPAADPDFLEVTVPAANHSEITKKMLEAAAPILNRAFRGETTNSAPSLRLGQITQRLGFTVTADFLSSLGFAPAATDKSAKLYHEHDFKAICAALQRHISTVAATAG